MFAKFARNVSRLFRRAPLKVRANNVFTLEEIRRAHFFNASARAIRAQGLCGKYLDRCVNHAVQVWDKHRDRAPGYEMPADAEKAMRDYIDLQARYQRNDQPAAPDRPWSPSAA